MRITAQKKAIDSLQTIVFDLKDSILVQIYRKFVLGG